MYNKTDIVLPPTSLSASCVVPAADTPQAVSVVVIALPDRILCQSGVV